MARILLDNVTKRFGSVVAVDRLNLEIRDKEFVVLLGPSGCGKSTTLNLIAGLETVSEGDLYFDDTIINDTPPHRRDVAMVFQSYALYPHKSLHENIAFGLRMRKFNRQEIDRRVKDVAERLDIAHLLDRRPYELSGGQQQRVALGRAIVRQPAVFLMDEPLSNLDAALRVSMRAEIKRLHQTMRTTFVYVTHDQAEALTLADRIVVMKDGVAQQGGTPTEIYDRPCNMFVASFLGSPRMNLLEGTLEGEDKRVVFRRGALSVALPPSARDKLADHVGEDVILGMRPEDVDERAAAIDYETIHGRVNFVLSVGSDQHLSIDVDGQELFFRVGRDARYAGGDPVALAINIDRLHVFDRKTTRSLLWDTGSEGR